MKRRAWCHELHWPFLLYPNLYHFISTLLCRLLAAMLACWRVAVWLPIRKTFCNLYSRDCGTKPRNKGSLALWSQRLLLYEKYRLCMIKAVPVWLVKKVDTVWSKTTGTLLLLVRQQRRNFKFTKAVSSSKAKCKEKILRVKLHSLQKSFLSRNLSC